MTLLCPYCEEPFIRDYDRHEVRCVQCSRGFHYADIITLDGLEELIEQYVSKVKGKEGIE